MAKKKLSTAEILAAARGQDGGGTAPADGASADAGTDAPEAAGAEEAPKAAPSNPTSTTDILAAARAQGGDGAKPAAAKPAAAGAKPAAAGGSTADILAAARAQVGGGGAAKTAKPAATKPAAKKADPTSKAAPSKAAAATGDVPSVQEMLKAVREKKPGQQPAAPVKPKLPSKPIKPAKQDEGRRWAFLAILATPFMFAWLVLTAATTAFTLGMALFMMPNVLVEPPTQFKIGPPSDYPPDAVSTKWKAERAIWVVNTFYKGRQLIYALSTVCTHLGCTPNWLEGEQKFKCPCHGSGFYINGVNFEGPAPRPLERYGLRLAEDGMLEVDKSVKFQEEMGQWDDPASFHEVA